VRSNSFPATTATDRKQKSQSELYSLLQKSENQNLNFIFYLSRGSDREKADGFGKTLTVPEW
jgi:hypothetical protein